VTTTDDLARLSSAASSGPWTYSDVDSVGGGTIYDTTRSVADVVYEQPEDHDGTIVRHLLSPEADANGALIVASVNYVRALLALPDEPRWGAVPASTIIDALQRRVRAMEEAHSANMRARGRLDQLLRASRATGANMVSVDKLDSALDSPVAPESLTVQIDQRLDHPTHVRVERGGVVLVDGYLRGPDDRR
jgi:hypothetical protein